MQCYQRPFHATGYVLKYLTPYLVLLCSGTGQGPEGFYDPTDTPNPLATTREKYLWGLLKGKEYARGNIIVKEVQGRGDLHLQQKTSEVEILCVIMGRGEKKNCTRLGR